MIYDHEAARKEQKKPSSLTTQRASTNKDNYGSEYEAFRNRSQPRVNIDILQMMRETEQAISTQVTSEPPIQAQVAETANKTGLPDNLKAGIENLSGYSMNDVKVHYNSAKPSQLQAHAYAQGTDIHLAPGQEKHLPHEAWHVVQQMQGRVKPTLQTQGVAINDDCALEREADQMGMKATSVKRPDTNSSNVAPIQQAAVIQRIALDGQPLHYNLPYNNNNQQAILEHMAGEWQKNNNGAVTGGHLLTEMENKWGAAVSNSNPQAQGAHQANPADGVHFPGTVPRVRRVIGTQFTFKLVTTDNAQKRVSAEKNSTFWPDNWNNDSLTRTLQHSWQVSGNANSYASKENTNNSFWYRWQTLGGNTVFPNNTIGNVTDTERQRMRTGRAEALAYANRGEE